MTRPRATGALIGALALAMPMPAPAFGTAAIAVRSCGSISGPTRIPIRSPRPDTDGEHRCCAMACHAGERRKKAGPAVPGDDPPLH